MMRGNGSARYRLAAICPACLLLVLTSFLAGAAAAAEGDAAPVARRLMSLSIEELADVEVTTVSRRSESRLLAAAAVYVINREDIRRSGVTTLVEALRLAPGVEVARISGNQWAVGIRGFASRLSRSVLVLIDGRSVYTTLFAGTYWEAQDTLLEDVERIEVVRGPGGALWGANAVNGVINIITRKAGDTLGGHARIGGGSHERAFGSFRWGGEAGERTAYRIYGQYAERGAHQPVAGEPFDDWQRSQVGFRVDSTTAAGHSLIFHGDGYSSRNGERTLLSSFTRPYRYTLDDTTELSGGNILGRWERQTEKGALTLQGFYDRNHRRQPDFREQRQVFDLDLQNRVALGKRHQLVWGAGFRTTSSDTVTGGALLITPPSRTEQLYSAFVQDEISLGKSFRLTLGTKLEHNDYSGFEFQPTLRFAFMPREAETAWLAVSKAVRTPSRVEFDVNKSNGVNPNQPLFVRLIGDGNFRPERVIAYEAGYRRQLGKQVYFDFAAFYNDLDYLTTGEQLSPFFVEGQPPNTRFVLPFGFRNGLEGLARGLEVSVDATLAPWLKLRSGYSFLELNLGPSAGSTDLVSGPRIEGSSPRHRATLAIYADLPRKFGIDATLRAVDRLPALDVPGYVNLDLRFSWQPSPRTELSLVGQGLLQADHLEFDPGEAGPVKIERGFYGTLAWRF
jgi:iron complex outermembrane recepter protein